MNRAALANLLRRGRWVLLPVVIALVLGGVLLALTGGLAQVTPFHYAIF
jgi:hypothetical protein